MHRKLGTVLLYHSVNVQVWNTLCGSCAVILSKALTAAQCAPQFGHDASESFPTWEIVEAADRVADLLTGRKV